MRLSAAIAAAEDKLERGLSGDELALISRMVDADKAEEEILAMLEQQVPTPADDGKVYRYEARGDRVVEIE